MIITSRRHRGSGGGISGGGGGGGLSLYVAPPPTGSDTTGNGTQAAPYATIAKASTVVQPGYTVRVAPGDYVGNFQTLAAGTANARITYLSTTKWGARLVHVSSNPTATCWINGSESTTTGIPGSYVTIDGFHVDGTTYTTGTRWAEGIYLTGTGSIVQNCKIHEIVALAPPSSQGGAGIGPDSYYGGTDMAAYNNFIYRVYQATFAGEHAHAIYSSCDGFTAMNNLIVGPSDGCGIQCWHGATRQFLVNNTIIGLNGSAILIGSGGLPAGQYQTGGNNNGRIFNNIIADVNYGISEQVDSSGSVSGNQWSNNRLYNVAISAVRLINGSNANQTTTDPSFVNLNDLDTGDYHLQSGSDCIAGGLTALSPISAPLLDFDGVTRGASNDLGAYEFVSGGGGGGSTQIWNVAQTNASIALSGSNLIATKTSGTGTYGRVFALNGVTTGMYYWEIVLATTTQSQNCNVGIGNTSSNTTTGQYLGIDTDTLGWWFGSGNAGIVWNNNATVNTWETFSGSPTVLCFAMDLTSATKKIWGRIAGGNWNNAVIGSQNPVGSVGGLVIPSAVLAASVVPGATLCATTTPDSVTARFTSASWQFTAPTGFVAMP